MSLDISNDPESLLFSTEQLEYGDYFTLDCRMNTLALPFQGKMVNLSESQKRLMICLIKNIHCKRKIINFVWHECHQRIRDNNYHQLIYQFRTNLVRNGIPGGLLVTIPHHGLVLNVKVLQELKEIKIESQFNKGLLFGIACKLKSLFFL